MPVSNIVRGQKIKSSTWQRAKEMRRAMTPAEERLWAALRRNQLDGLHFRRQQVISGFIVDFYCHAAGLVVEVDGPIHNEQAERDAERDRILTSRGLRVLRFKNEQVMQELEEVLRMISAACDLTPRPPSDLTPRPPSLGGKGEASPLPVGEGSGEGVILLNFSHPLTAAQLAQLETLIGQPVTDVRDIPTQLDLDVPFAEHATRLADAANLTPAQWQTEPLLVILPSLNFAAAALLAELHGRMGYFPPVVRLKPVTGALPPRYEVAEVINLQAVRDAARHKR